MSDVATTTATTPATPRAKKLLGQSALLFSGYAGSQAMAFGRNAILGHVLSKGDFGTAAALTVTLQAIETISDLAADRMLVQAADGDDPKLLAGAHTLSILRGLVLGILLLAISPWVVPMIEIAGGGFWLLAGLALVPVIRGFANLDNRLAQRQFDNRPAMAVEIGPQAIALAVTFPLITLVPDGRVALLIAIAQACAIVVVSHLIARSRYRLGFDRAVLMRFLKFGWPILLSALPVLIVYQGDRMIVGSFLGMEALAAYTVAFLIAMVPGTLASKAAVSLMLPVLAPVAQGPRELERRFALLSELMVLVAGLYLVGLTFLGGHLGDAGVRRRLRRQRHADSGACADVEPQNDPGPRRRADDGARRCAAAADRRHLPLRGAGPDARRRMVGCRSGFVGGDRRVRRIPVARLRRLEPDTTRSRARRRGRNPLGGDGNRGDPDDHGTDAAAHRSAIADRSAGGDAAVTGVADCRGTDHAGPARRTALFIAKARRCLSDSQPAIDSRRDSRAPFYWASTTTR